MIRDLLARLRAIDEGIMLACAGENWVRKFLGELYVRYYGELAPLICEGIDDLCSGLDLLYLLGPCLPNSQRLLDALIFERDGLKSGRL